MHYCFLFISGIMETNNDLTYFVVDLSGVYYLVGFRLEENGVLTDCSLKTQDPDETLDFNFCSANVVNKIIMKVGLAGCSFICSVITIRICPLLYILS